MEHRPRVKRFLSFNFCDYLFVTRLCKFAFVVLLKSTIILYCNLTYIVESATVLNMLCIFESIVFKVIESSTANPVSNIETIFLQL